MLRPASRHAIDRLIAAVDASDRELDTALIQLGILPPLDLAEIRAWVGRSDANLRAAQNTDGHRVIEVVVGDCVEARVHHDGFVVTTDQPALASV